MTHDYGQIRYHPLTSSIRSTMSCSRQWKEDFSCSAFGLEHFDPGRFTRFEFGQPKLYLAWRGVMAAYHVVAVFLTGFLGTDTWTRTEADKVKWFVYLTHWMFLILTLSTIIDFLTALYAYFTRQDVTKGECSEMPVWLKVTWVWQNLGNNISILVSLLFWGLLYSPTYPLTDMDIITHAGNSIYVLVNLFLTASPSRFYHLTHTAILALIYILFTVIYQTAGGSNGLGRDYVYSVLDWGSQPGTAAMYACITVLVGVPLIQMILYLLYRARVKLYSLCMDNSATSDIEMASRKT